MATTSVADQLKTLVELQKLDAEIHRLRRELNSKPAEAARLKEAHERAVQGLQAAEARHKSLEVKRNQMETDLGQKEEQIKKLQVQLFQLKTNKEYAAMQREIEGFKADKSVLEEEVLKLMEEADRAKGQVAADRQVVKTQEEALAAQLQRIEEESQKIRASVEELRAARSALTPKVEPVVLAQYERILERKDGLALVPVRGYACGGCNMVLPPQVINEIQMGTRLVLCESCARILTVEPAESSA